MSKASFAQIEISDYKSEKQSIDRGFHFLTNNFEKLDSKFNLLVFQYINRVWHPNIEIDFTKKFESENNFDDEIESFIFFERLYKKDYHRPVNTDFYNLDSLVMLMVWAIHSDRIKLNQTFEQIFSVFLDSTYNVRYHSHLSLCIKWIYDVNIEKPKFINENSLQKLEALLIKGIETEKPHTDSGLEGIVGLILIGKTELIKKDWIHHILKNQQADGGWKWDDDAKFSNDHTTALAIWVLSAFTEPDKSNEKWIIH